MLACACVLTLAKFVALFIVYCEVDSTFDRDNNVVYPCTIGLLSIADNVTKRYIGMKLLLPLRMLHIAGNVM